MTFFVSNIEMVFMMPLVQEKQFSSTNILQMLLKPWPSMPSSVYHPGLFASNMEIPNYSSFLFWDYFCLNFDVWLFYLLPCFFLFQTQKSTIQKILKIQQKNCIEAMIRPRFAFFFRLSLFCLTEMLFSENQFGKPKKKYQ